MASIGSLFGGKSEIDDILAKLTSTIQEIPKAVERTENSDVQMADAIRSAIEVMKEENPDDNLDDLTSVHTIFNGIQIGKDRLARYATYDTIYSNVQIVKRIIQVYVNSVFVKDTIDSKSLTVKTNDKATSTTEKDKYKRFVGEFLEYFNFEDRLKSRVAFNVFKYGDSFVEVIDTSKLHPEFPTVDVKKKGSLASTYVKEGDDIRALQTKLSSKNEYTGNLDDLDLESIAHYFIEFIEDDPEQEQEQEKSKNSEDVVLEAQEEVDQKSDENRFSNILLKFHKPNNIIPLVTDFDSVLGYVEIVENTRETSSYNTNSQLYELVKNISTASNNTGSDKSPENLIKIFSNHVVKKILQKANVERGHKETKFEYEQSIKNKLEPELYSSIKKILAVSDPKNMFGKKLQVRYIQPDMMFQFTTPSSDYFPLGQSVIDALVYPAKLYLLTQLSNIVTKLSRASLVRKWIIETGTNENHSGLLQKLKREFKNQRISAGDLVDSTKDIPNMLSDFRDLVVFTKNGQRFIDVEMQQHGDPNIGIRDLEDLRREIINLSGVPSSHLGMQDPQELREKLVHTNINFATEIINYQQGFNIQIAGILNTVGSLTNLEKPVSDYVTVSLIPPFMLMMQQMESVINSVSNMQRMMVDMPGVEIDSLSMLEKFIPYIDWKEMNSKGELLKKKLDITQPPPADQGF